MRIVLKYYLRIIMFLMPLMFLPVISDSFGYGRLWLMVALGIIGLGLWMVGWLIGKKNEIKINNGWIWMVVMLVWSLLTWLKMSAGLRMGSLVNYFGLGGLVAVVVWYFLWLQEAEEGERKIQMNYLTAAGILTALVSLVIFLIPPSKLPLLIPRANPIFQIDSGWSMTGSLVSEIILLGVLVMEWLKRFLKKIRTGDYWGEGAVIALLSLVLLLNIYRLNRVGWTKLDNQSGWVIAAESFKNSPVWGVGVGNFNQAFNLWRPVSYNTGKFWTSGFKSSSMSSLQIWTELGLAGALVVVMLAGLIWKNRKKTINYGRIVILFLAVMLVPTDFIGWMLLAWVLVGGLGKKREIKISLKVGEKATNIGPWLTAVVLVVIMAFGGYWWTRILLGEIYMRQSMVMAAKNNGGDTYNLQIKAIGMNPYLADYRRYYSQTNLAIALTLLNDKDISEDDKQKATVLVQQAVREAKSAVSLESLNSYYWTNLASIYRQLIGVVDGTADWSYQAYSQAAALDPVNVLTKLDLGGLLFAAGRYPESERVFEQVVMNKQDYANGWYNWAYSAKLSGKLGEAVARLSQAVALVPVDSGDYEKAIKELGDWKKEYEAAVKKLGATTPTPTPEPETLKTPEPLPTTTKEDKVNVPDDLAPEVTPTSENN